MPRRLGCVFRVALHLPIGRQCQLLREENTDHAPRRLLSRRQPCPFVIREDLSGLSVPDILCCDLLGN
jgi:hypothetical protein